MARALVFLLFLAASCTLDPPRKETLVEGLPPTENIVQLKGVAIDRFERDRLRTRAELREAHIDRERGTIAGEDVAIRVLDEAGDTTAAIRAPRGRAQHGSAVLEGGVVLTDRDQRVVRSETMVYDGANDQISVPGPVTIEGSNFRASGASLIGMRRDQLIDVTGPLTATVSSQGAPINRQ